MWAYLLTDGLSDNGHRLTTATDYTVWETINYHSRPHQPTEEYQKLFKRQARP